MSIEMISKILIVDDNVGIHNDFRKILIPKKTEISERYDLLESDFFDDENATISTPSFTFELVFASQGQEAFELVKRSVARKEPFQLAFMDVRMPPGWNGIETTEKIWKVDPNIEIVICSAFSDYSWSEISNTLKTPDRWVILKKPFDPIEVQQLSHSLSAKWFLHRDNIDYMNNLEEKIEERTAELETTQSELLRAQRLEVLGRLSAGVGHEINNPLMFVSANIEFAITELLKSDPEKFKGVIKDLNDAKSGADRIRRIVADMRSFSRPDKDEIAAVDLNKVFSVVSNMIGNQLKSKAMLIIDVDEIPKVAGVKGKLEQVFINLLVNAAEAIPDGQARENTICVSTTIENDNVIIDVTDSGSGIDSDDLEHLFEPFFSKKSNENGLGLGLSICHRIIRSFGGDLEAMSELGKGTTMRVSLPIATKEQIAKISSTTDSFRPLESSSTNEKLHILIVDDEPLVASALKRLLGKSYDAEIANSGRDALDLCLAEDYDVVLCDLMMGDMTGMSLYEDLCKEKEHYSKRFVFVTGGAYTPSAETFIRVTKSPCLTKPATPKDLDQAILSVRRGVENQ